MPQLIKHIDKIAREKERDVLYISFDHEKFSDYDYQNWAVRKALLHWFQENEITVMPCGEVANENGFESYRGQLYIDVPFDESLPEYQKVCARLENADGSMRVPGVHFCCLPLKVAIRNKYHDEPGFWDRWAENFWVCPTRLTRSFHNSLYFLYIVNLYSLILPNRLRKTYAFMNTLMRG